MRWVHARCSASTRCLYCNSIKASHRNRPPARLQEMGHAVDVLVRENNVCATKEQLLKVATGLRVPLNPDLLSLEVVTVKGIHIFVSCLHAWQSGRYELR